MIAAPLRLCVFDLDGTLVDSRAVIVACAQAAFVAEGFAPPSEAEIRRIVGLSLMPAMAILLGREDPDLAHRIADRYREAFQDLRSRPELEEPLFPGIAALLDELAARDLVLGIATGKAMRGLLDVLDRHGLRQRFTTLQTACRHPSKPHPAMLEAALAEAGVSAAAAVMIGDTTFDIAMARDAGVSGVGVAWGNHDGHELLAAGAEVLAHDAGKLASWLLERAAQVAAPA